jgi:protein TonB
LGNHETFAAFSDGALAAVPPRVSGFDLWWEDARESLRRRGGSATLVVILHALLLLLLLKLAPPFQEPVPMAEPTTVTLVPGEEAAPADAPKRAAKAKPAGGGAPAKAAKPPPVPTPKPPATDQPSKEPALKLWAGMEKFNLANVPSAGPAKSAGAPGASAGAGDSAIGTAPGGQPLYAAQWYRKPTSAELGGYLPKHMQNGWGMVACRTVEDYRVEDCKEVGQSPAGSGLSRAVRQAAWQFRVRPPRIGGKPMIGEWVRIRIEWNAGIPQ